jgi:hypothetical protein
MTIVGIILSAGPKSSDSDFKPVVAEGMPLSSGRKWVLSERMFSNGLTASGSLQSHAQ